MIQTKELFDIEPVFKEFEIQNENNRFDTESGKRGKDKRIARTLNNFVILKDGKMVTPTYASSTDKFWVGVEVFGFAHSLSGNARWHIMCGFWDTKCAGKHIALMHLKTVNGLCVETDPSWRGGKEDALWLETPKYSYALQLPANNYQSCWDTTLDSWKAVPGLPDPTYHDVDPSGPKPSWIGSLPAWRNLSANFHPTGSEPTTDESTTDESSTLLAKGKRGAKGKGGKSESTPKAAAVEHSQKRGNSSHGTGVGSLQGGSGTGTRPARSSTRKGVSRARSPNLRIRPRQDEGFSSPSTSAKTNASEETAAPASKRRRPNDAAPPPTQGDMTRDPKPTAIDIDEGFDRANGPESSSTALTAVAEEPATIQRSPKERPLGPVGSLHSAVRVMSLDIENAAKDSSAVDQSESIATSTEVPPTGAGGDGEIARSPPSPAQSFHVPPVETPLAQPTGTDLNSHIAPGVSTWPSNTSMTLSPENGPTNAHDGSTAVLTDNPTTNTEPQYIVAAASGEPDFTQSTLSEDVDIHSAIGLSRQEIDDMFSPESLRLAGIFDPSLFHDDSNVQNSHTEGAIESWLPAPDDVATGAPFPPSTGGTELPAASSHELGQYMGIPGPQGAELHDTANLEARSSRRHRQEPPSS